MDLSQFSAKDAVRYCFIAMIVAAEEFSEFQFEKANFLLENIDTEITEDDISDFGEFIRQYSLKDLLLYLKDKGDIKLDTPIPNMILLNTLDIGLTFGYMSEEEGDVIEEIAAAFEIDEIELFYSHETIATKNWSKGF